MAQNIAGHVVKFGLFATSTSLESLLIQLKKSMNYYPLGSEPLIKQIIDKFSLQEITKILSEKPDLDSGAAQNLIGILEQSQEPVEASPIETEEEYEASLMNHI